MTGKTTFKTLVNEWLKDKEDMIKPSTHAGFALIAENHLIPYWGKRHIESITEADIQEYVLILYRQGRLDGAGVPAVKTIRDVILVLRLSLTYAYKKKIIQALNRDMIEYPKEAGSSAVTALSKEQEQELIRSIYMHLNRKTAGILITLFTSLRIGELCGLRMCDISLPDGTITVRQTVQRIYDKKKGTSKINIGPPKTKSSERTIPFPSMLGKVIEKRTDMFSINYKSYIDMPQSLSFEQAIKLHEEMPSETCSDETAMEIYTEICEKAARYSEFRSKWLLARYLRMNGKAAAWRDELGDETSDPYIRKRIGDFGCYIALINGLNAR